MCYTYYDGNAQKRFEKSAPIAALLREIYPRGIMMDVM